MMSRIAIKNANNIGVKIEPCHAMLADSIIIVLKF